jgi:hypothetical protein
MPTLPLYDPAPLHPDAWHRVVAPGGYEAWHFDAEDEAGDVRILITFWQGSPFDSEYRRRYRAFLKRPTRRMPPLPAEFPTVSFLLWEKGRTLARFAYRYPPEAFDASPAGPEVRIGPHRLLPGAGGTLALTIADVPVGAGTARVSAELWFTPKFPATPVERRFPSREAVGADHCWSIANPLCAVSGIVRLAGQPPAPAREIHLTVRGYHDHRYGTAPLYETNDVRWIRGRVLMDGRATAFQYFERGPEGCYVEADAAGTREVTPVKWQPDAEGLGRLYLKDGLTLESSKALDANPFSLTFAYDAIRSGKRVGTGLCEVARLRTGLARRAGDVEDAP